MAYTHESLSILVVTDDFSMWSYRTPDHINEVCGFDYFNQAGAMLSKGDVIFCNTSIDEDFEAQTWQLSVKTNDTDGITVGKM